MGKPITVLHCLLLTLGLAAAQAGTAFTFFFGGKSRKKHQAFKVRFSIVLGILTYSFIMCLF